MNGAILLFSQYVPMVWKWQTLPFCHLGVQFNRSLIQYKNFGAELIKSTSLLQNVSSSTCPSELLLSFHFIFVMNILLRGDCGGTVVKVLRYKLEGRWFDSRWCHWNFSLT